MSRVAQIRFSATTPPASARTPGSSAPPLKMARMNSSVAALALLLAVGFFLHTQAQPGQHAPCCFGYNTKPIPLKLLASYEVPSKCSLPAVVFYTKGNKTRCADPEASWTKDRMAKLPQKGQQANP